MRRPGLHPRARPRRAAAARRPRPRHAPRHARRPASSTRAHQSRDGYDAVVEALRSGCAGARCSSPCPPTEADAVVAVASADPGVVDARVVAEPAADGPHRRAGHAGDRRRRRGHLRARRAGCATSSPTPRPTRSLGGPGTQNHDLTAALTGTGAAGHRRDHARRVRAAARGVPQPADRASPRSCSTWSAWRPASASPRSCSSTASAPALLGIEHQGFVDAWAPLFFFALLFGLSMDYQLFLLAAIKERRDATGDARLAVREGIARTGRPITNAALIMIVVFVAFGVTGPIPPTELGVTLAARRPARRHRDPHDARPRRCSGCSASGPGACPPGSTADSPTSTSPTDQRRDIPCSSASTTSPASRCTAT